MFSLRVKINALAKHFQGRHISACEAFSVAISGFTPTLPPWFCANKALLRIAGVYTLYIWLSRAYVWYEVGFPLVNVLNQARICGNSLCGAFRTLLRRDTHFT